MARRPDPDFALRSAILDAAVEAISASGSDGLRIADVARRAGVAYGLVYHYFGTKDALVVGAVAHRFASLARQIDEIVSAGGSAPDMVRRLVRGLLDTHRQDSSAMRSMLRLISTPDGVSGEAALGLGELLSPIAEIFSGAIARGELRPGADPRLLAAMLFGAVEMGLRELAGGSYGDTDTQRIAEQVSQCFLWGAAAPPGSTV